MAKDSKGHGSNERGGAKNRMSDPHVDHKTPLARGGSNLAENLHLVCKPCNSSKGAQTHEEFLARRIAA